MSGDRSVETLEDRVYDRLRGTFVDLVTTKRIVWYTGLQTQPENALFEHSDICPKNGLFDNSDGIKIACLSCKPDCL